MAARSYGPMRWRLAAGLTGSLLVTAIRILTADSARAADPCSARQTSAPLAIDSRVLDGSAKGLVGIDGVILSTKLSNSAWTSFSSQVSGTTIRGFAGDPTTIPLLSAGDDIALAHASAAGNYQALAARWNLPATLVLPIVDTQGDVGAVEGFATVRVLTIQASGSPRYVEGTLLAVDHCPGDEPASGEPTTF